MDKFSGDIVHNDIAHNGLDNGKNDSRGNFILTGSLQEKEFEQIFVGRIKIKHNNLYDLFYNNNFANFFD
ncbi:MAG TPA: hypothetical protein QKA14_00170 [Candidatus Megaira endosymbiont of Hartmannula sinica]|nr:hypothetical protein [Candidatus Megaera endosymbiont of Hartmannula sinica]